MDNVQKAIDLANHLGEKVETITFEAIRSNDNGAALYKVHLASCGEDRYIIEGETGEMLDPIETEDAALEAWNAS